MPANTLLRWEKPQYPTYFFPNNELPAWYLHNMRLIPDGAITGAHFVQTPDYVQVTGVGDLTLLNIPAGDDGGELDPHGADGNGTSIQRAG